MEEREAHYIADFFHGLRHNALAGYRIGDPRIYWTPGESPQSRECRLVFPTIGGRSAGSVLSALCRHVGNQREIELCSQKRNVWISKMHCLPTDDYKVGVHQADWMISIWTESQFLLPQTGRYRASDVLPQKVAPELQFDLGHEYRDGDELEEHDLEVVDGEETDEELLVDEIRQRARKISKFIAEHRLSDDVFVLPIHYGPTPSKSFLLYMIHGITVSFRGMGLARDLIKEFSFLNAVGLQELNDEHRARGWEGKYVIQLAELRRDI